MSIRKMPRDVQTRWNSTYDMMKFALEYRAAIDKLTSKGEKDHGLRQYELSSSEWKLAKQLADVLKVR